MAADLTFAGFVRRSSIVLLDDHLVLLEHSATRDRVRRIPYDRVESVLSWRRLPWARLILIGLLFVASGLMMFTIGDLVGKGLLAIPLVVTALIVARYLYMGVTKIRITRADKHYDFSGILSPRKVARCLSRLDESIRRAQQHAEEQILARQESLGSKLEQ